MRPTPDSVKETVALTPAQCSESGRCGRGQPRARQQHRGHLRESNRSGLALPRWVFFARGIRPERVTRRLRALDTPDIRPAEQAQPSHRPLTGGISRPHPLSGFEVRWPVRFGRASWEPLRSLSLLWEEWNRL